MDENSIGNAVIETAIQIHKELGPGLLESVYETVLAHELQKRHLEIERQFPIPIKYKKIKFDQGFRADIIIEGKVILEIKSVESISNVHKKQLLTYLRLGNYKLGYLLNFGDSLMKAGITRIVNNL